MVPSRLWALLCGLCLTGLSFCGPAQAGVAIRFDYTYDQHGFFNDPLRRELLELSAAQVIRFIDRLDPIVPSGPDTWTYVLARPDDPNHVLVTDDTVPADTIKVYVGAQPFSSGYLAMATKATVFTVSGSQAWQDTVWYRGQSGAAGVPATDYSVFAGSIGYNSTKNWYFSHDTDGLNPGNVDFLTVATHELLHLLGIGPAASWRAQIVDGRFTGSYALEAGSSTNPQLQLDASGGHWSEGTVSVVGESAQAALMDPSPPYGQRRRPTALDRAALQDIGWLEAAAGDTDLDRDIDGFDIQNILAAATFPYDLTGKPATWASGDFTGDGRCDGFDIQAILATNLFGTGPYAVVPPGANRDAAAGLVLDPASNLGWSAVPESGTAPMLLLALLSMALGWSVRRRRTRP